jgi:ABC-type tungstate transport system permease subunit
MRQRQNPLKSQVSFIARHHLMQARRSYWFLCCTSEIIFQYFATLSGLNTATVASVNCRVLTEIATYFAYFSKLKLEAVRSSDTSVNFYQTIRHHNPEHSTLFRNSLQNFWFAVRFMSFFRAICNIISAPVLFLNL